MSRVSRWQLANMNEEMSYNRFSQDFGTEINDTTTPLLIHLLDRAVRDVQNVAFNAKSFCNRPRPFQRFQMAHVCGADEPPAPEIPLKGGSSYPSGHTSFGWTTALILSDIAPEHAQQLLARGQEYGESRVVCAMHYLSDVVGGPTCRHICCRTTARGPGVEPRPRLCAAGASCRNKARHQVDFRLPTSANAIHLKATLTGFYGADVDMHSPHEGYLMEVVIWEMKRRPLFDRLNYPLKIVDSIVQRAVRFFHLLLARRIGIERVFEFENNEFGQGVSLAIAAFASFGVIVFGQETIRVAFVGQVQQLDEGERINMLRIDHL